MEFCGVYQHNYEFERKFERNGLVITRRQANLKVRLMFPTSGQMSYSYAIKVVIVRSYLRLPGHRSQPFSFFFFKAAEAAPAIDWLEDKVYSDASLRDVA